MDIVQPSVALDSEVPCQWRCLRERVQVAPGLADVSAQEMADRLEVERNTISRPINGRTTPPATALRVWTMRTG